MTTVSMDPLSRFGMDDFNFGIGSPGSYGLPNMTGGGPSPIGASGPSLGLNFDTAKLALTGLSSIGNLWAAFNAQKLAREQFNFSKDFANRNLANQTTSYNTQLSDRARSRGFVEGQSQSQIDDYVRLNSLQNSPVR